VEGEVEVIAIEQLEQRLVGSTKSQRYMFTNRTKGATTQNSFAPAQKKVRCLDVSVFGNNQRFEKSPHSITGPLSSHFQISASALCRPILRW
jgi:CRISPR/Cas system type I-B associated protein Csh2 (Cas7 group RAMP superfamily)